MDAQDISWTSAKAAHMVSLCRMEDGKLTWKDIQGLDRIRAHAQKKYWGLKFEQCSNGNNVNINVKRNMNQGVAPFNKRADIVKGGYYNLLAVNQFETHSIDDTGSSQVNTCGSMVSRTESSTKIHKNNAGKYSYVTRITSTSERY